MSFPLDYTERVYAGVLGKIIGVYLGRPFEGWSYDRLTERFGEITEYVHDQLGVPLIVADDDISGTFTFLRALEDYDCNPALTAGQIGQTWLNYIIEERTILWWGGLGVSSEHTAYLRLKRGIPAPESGSIARNGQVVAEQIGAQIFIDGWGLINPGDPERAADFARRAGSVSHDGEAIYGAQIVAALVAGAFTESNIDKLLDTAVSLIPRDSVIFQLIADIREWKTVDRDWRKTRVRIDEKYGYAKFGGGCHMVPNHALITLALVYGDGKFGESLKIVNTSGWDTDCNSGNVGCILGVLGGLAGLKDAGDWRGPVADKLYLPTADGGRGITDAVQETLHIANMGLRLHGLEPISPKGGARFSFFLPGSVQGFTRQSGLLRITNPGGAGLLLKGAGRVSTPAFVQTDAKQPGYGLVTSPSIYPGQTLRAKFGAGSTPVTGQLFVTTAADGNKPIDGPIFSIGEGKDKTVEWTIPDTDGVAITTIGLQIDTHGGAVTMEWLTWDGTPTADLTKGKDAKAAWVHSFTRFEQRGENGVHAIQNAGRGMAITGTREWENYALTGKISAHMASSAGLAVRVQGLKRYYALLLTAQNEALLVKRLDGEAVLARTPFAFAFDREYDVRVNVHGTRITASVDGKELFDVVDATRPLLSGAVAIVVEEGNAVAREVRVTP
ncbi:MAG: ADP-ribosylglycohydrolase family protein [Capsulimonadaceae bacterium]|nr:ADP-ribosylglycohydrolase family protein [Capsulimonadaceae bacterium]